MAEPAISTLDDLYRRLAECSALDRRRLHARLRDLERGARGEQAHGPPAPVIAAIIADIDRSAAAVETRRRSVPAVSYPGDLPVAARRGEIAEAIRGHQVVVLCGQTGSGKTTQLPKICLEVGRGVRGFIGHTQPRRIAARAVASRVAQELGTGVGAAGLVGCKVRFHDDVGGRALIKVMTDGVLLAETQHDRSLDRYDTIIIDEAHERSLNIDFLLGYLRQLLPRRPDLKLIITSATIDPRAFAAHFKEAGKPEPPVIEVSGRTYPVEVRYRPPDGAEEDDQGTERGLLDAVDELAREGEGDVLVFLPGEREIRETAEALRKHHPRGSEVVPLYARLSVEEQQRVFVRTAPGVRRIVLATNVAETSLTVPGIRFVVDTGVARISRYSPRIKVQRLPIERVSKASAEQRKGRCGRTAPGVCIRLYGEDDYGARPEYTDPEILRTNLASVILQMKALALGDIEEFPFMQPPEPRAVRDGYDTLLEINALEGGGLRADLTPTGRRLARLPIDPRIGRMILAADAERALPEVLIIAAALSVQDPRDRPMDKAEQADAAHEAFRDERSDFLTFLNIWRELHKRWEDLSGGRFRAYCRERFISFLRFREWQDIHRQLHEIIADMGYRLPGRGERGFRPASYEAIHRSLLTGLLSNIARRGESARPNAPVEYQGARGNTYSVFPGSTLFRKEPRWVMAADIVKTTRTYARNAAVIQPQWIEALAQHLVKRTYAEPHWDARSAQAMVCESVHLYGLEIVNRRRVALGPIDPRQSRAIFIAHALVNGEYLTKAPFFEHNHGLEREIKKLGEKVRRSDLVADQASRFRFYDQRVPPEVSTGRDFEYWRRKAEAREPRLLLMEKRDLIAPGAVEPAPEQFPDAITVAGHPLRLEYRHDPGADDDGVTAVVPETLLAHLPDEPFEWLVPGMLREKAIALIKELPKNLRASLAPAPVWADRVLPRMAFAQGDLYESLTDSLRAADGVYVPVEVWPAAGLAPHLQMRFRVVGERGETIAAGRDVDAIRADLAKRATEALARLPAGPLNRSGIATWEWEELPRTAEVADAGRRSRLIYPALVDEGAQGEVSIRPFDTAAKAGEAMSLGLRRLLALQVGKESRSLIATMPGLQRLAVLHAPMGTQAQLVEDLAELTAMMAFDESGASPPPPAADVRTRVQFDAHLDWGWDRLGACGRRAFDLAERILTAHQRVGVILEEASAGPPTPASQVRLADIRAQLAHLILPGFLRRTPHQWLAHYPRYLEAVERRLKRVAAEGEGRDAEAMERLLPFWNHYLIRAEHARGVPRLLRDPALIQYRWMVEEYRVSLFAQQLGTPVPISPKRLEAQWSRVAAI